MKGAHYVLVTQRKCVCVNDDFFIVLYDYIFGL